jgi:hypothetical protein
VLSVAKAEHKWSRQSTCDARRVVLVPNPPWLKLEGAWLPLSLGDGDGDWVELLGFGDGLLGEGLDAFDLLEAGSFDVDSKSHDVCLIRVLIIYRLR